MPLLLSRNTDHYDLYIWKLSEKEEDFADLIRPSRYQEILNNNKLSKRRLEKMSQSVLMTYCKLNDKEDLIYQNNGKPHLKDGRQISFSHSGLYSALMIAKEKCAVDVEEENPKVLRISSKFINDEERKFISDMEDHHWAWCIKECVFKYYGENVTFKKDINILNISPQEQKAVAEYKGLHGENKFDFELMKINNYYLVFTNIEKA